MSTLLVGDVAGHLSALDSVLKPFGVSVTDGHVPEGVVVVQVGDLVGRSSESEQLVRTVDRIRRQTPDRWVQLAGNHEMHHLGGHQFQGTVELSPAIVEILTSWLHDGWLRIAHDLNAGTRGTLVTHAGLTRATWLELGSPLTAREAAATLQDGCAPTSSRWELVNQPGRMLSLGRFPLDNPAAGPIWAEATYELLTDWIEHGDLPFGQVHGHSSSYDWFRGRYRNPAMRSHSRIDREARHVIVSVADGRSITGIDPGFGRDAHDWWAPLVLD